jgi:hypothetical protein
MLERYVFACECALHWRWAKMTICARISRRCDQCPERRCLDGVRCAKIKDLHVEQQRSRAP